MWFSCEKSVLQEAIDTVQKACSSKTTYPILEGILINAIEDRVFLTATDLDLGIETYFDAKVNTKGSIVLNSKIFGDFIRKLPNDTITIKLENNSVQINCQKSEITLIGNDPSEFPKLPVINENSMYKIPQEILKNMIRQTLFAVSQDETRNILTGVLFEVKDSILSFVSLDRYRLALKSYEIGEGSNISAVIPGKTLSEVSKILEPLDEDVNITFTPNHILFNLGNTKIISRLLDGEFINYRQIIPGEYNKRIKVNVSDITDSIERASLFVREGKTNLIKFDIKCDKIIITSNSQIGKAHEEIEIEFEGEEMKIAFNSKYLIDVLRIIDSEEIYVELTSSVNPCIIKKVDSNDYTYLVLPVRISEND